MENHNNFKKNNEEAVICFKEKYSFRKLFPCRLVALTSLIFSNYSFAQADLSGNYRIDDGQMNGILFLGEYSSASLILNAGRSASYNGIRGAVNSGSSSYILVSGQGSHLATTSNSPSGFLHVGQSGTGTLEVLDGGLITINNRLVVGYYAGAVGSVTVSGQGSRIEVANDFFSGAGGEGNTIIEKGGEITSGGGIISQSAKSSVTVTGAGSRWTVSGKITISPTDSLLDINSQGVVNANTLNMAAGGSESSILIDGNGSQLNITSLLEVDDGIVSVTNQGSLNTGSASIGTADGMPNITVKGGGSEWVNTGIITVGGGGGSVNINVLDAGVIETDSLQVSGNDKNNLTISGVGSEFKVSNLTSVNSGSVNILSGALFETNNSNIGASNTLGSTTKINIDGSSSVWRDSGDISFGGGSGKTLLTVKNSGVVDSVNFNALSNAVITGNSIIRSKLNLRNGSVISPGDFGETYSTLTVNGDMVMSSGSTYEVSGSTDANANDKIIVSGNADISDGSLFINASGSTYAPNVYFTILEAGTLQGQFKAENVTSNYQFLTSDVDYSVPNTVRIGYSRNNINYGDLALTPNQKSTAGALEKMAVTDKLDEFLDTLPAGSVPNVYDLLSGEIHATLRSSLLNWSSSTGQSSLEQLRVGLMSSNNCTSGENSKLDVQQQQLQNCIDTSPITGWAQVVGNWRQTSSDGNAAKSKASTEGLLLGADYGNAANGWRVGAMFGYGMTDDKSNPRNSSAKLHNYTLGLHAGKRFGWGVAEYVNVMGGLSYTHHSIKSDRSIPRIDQQLKAKYSGNTIQAFGEVGYAMAPVGKWMLEPFIGLNVAKQKVGSFEESGGFAGVHSKAESKTYTTTTLGLHAQSDLEVSGKPMKVRGTVGLKQALGNKEVTRTMAFNVGSPDYLIWGVPRSSSTLVLGVQGHMALSPTTTFEAGFNGEFGSKVREQSIQARVRWAF